MSFLTFALRVCTGFRCFQGKSICGVQSCALKPAVGPLPNLKASLALWPPDSRPRLFEIPVGIPGLLLSVARCASNLRFGGSATQTKKPASSAGLRTAGPFIWNSGRATRMRSRWSPRWRSRATRRTCGSVAPPRKQKGQPDRLAFFMEILVGLPGFEPGTSTMSR